MQKHISLPIKMVLSLGVVFSFFIFVLPIHAQEGGGCTTYIDVPQPTLTCSIDNSIPSNGQYYCAGSASKYENGGPTASNFIVNGVSSGYVANGYYNGPIAPGSVVRAISYVIPGQGYCGNAKYVDFVIPNATPIPTNTPPTAAPTQFIPTNTPIPFVTATPVPTRITPSPGVTPIVTQPAGKQFNATEVITALGSSINFHTKNPDYLNNKEWKIENYPQNSRINRFDYSYFQTKLGTKMVKYTANNGTNLVNCNDVEDGKVYEVTGSLTITSPFSGGCDNKRVTFLIDDTLTIGANFAPQSNSLFVFIAQNNIVIKSDVNVANGVFITDHQFISSNAQIAQPLTSKGAWIAYGKDNSTGLDLSKRKTSGNGLTEQVTFDPMIYFWFNQTIGTSAYIWNEIAP